MEAVGDHSLGLHDGDEETRRLREMFARSPSFSALFEGPEHRFALVNPAYAQLIGHRNVIGLTVREVMTEVESLGFLGLLNQVFATGEVIVGSEIGRASCRERV